MTTPRDEATQAQVTAARPDASTWLAANAGSGKTRVLTDRVARLLLDGVEPQHILCLTYTKAAASEMQNRLFKRLGEWTMLPDTDLHAALTELGADQKLDDAKLKEARTLFARAIETPGGLKIQTIHSFCASLLRRFPLEARVSPQFTEIEDRAAELLRAEIVDAMADGPDAQLISDLAQYDAGDDFNGLSKAVVQHRDLFKSPLALPGILHHLGQPGDLTPQSIADTVFLGGEQDIIDTIVPPMLEKGKTDGKNAEKLQAIDVLDFSALPAFEDIFLNKRQATSPFSAKIGSFPTKPTQTKLTDVMPALEDFMQRVEVARPARLAYLSARKTEILHRFAARFLPLYEESKTLRGWLDFDDLIERARALLRDESVAAWVLWRIDGGIDHILVDEAQDTSPAQWDVIRLLAAEFTSGAGARDDVERTIFVVGDKKQSIYSFQGADPREFDRMRNEFQTRLEAAEKRFQKKTLAYSFRSAAAILDVVDHTFEGQTDAGFNADETHKAFKSALPGRVDLWPLIEKPEEPEEPPWYEPLDRIGATHQDVILAEQIAGKIKWMIDSGQTAPVDGPSRDKPARRPVQAGDFLILVRRRGTLFSEIIRACKSANLDIAGADRLKVGGELAVRDLGALLSFLATPEDDLSLAVALKSPLFGWNEQDLFTLAQGRGRAHLWQTLRENAQHYPKTMGVLNDLRRWTDFLRPYDLVERILNRHHGRHRLLARLGVEAEDGINALLTQALAYERTAVPSLTGFLVWMETDDLEIKRQIDSASNQIRVMTVHGAKGLEAPVVILPETGKRDIRINAQIVTTDGVAMWKTTAAETPPPMDATLNALRTAETEEALRLLYVALTRAEKWLIIACSGALSPQNDSWYQRVDAALDALGAVDMAFGGLQVKRHATGDWDTLPLIDADRSMATTARLESFFNEPADPVAPISDRVTPSDLGGDKALPGDAGRTEDEAKAYGSLVHLFLEHLATAPQRNWPQIVAALSDPEVPDTDEAAQEAMRILQIPELRFLFGPDSLGEIPVSAPFGTVRLSGIIDRLVISDDRILAVDFKTNATVPETADRCPNGILRQMGAYLHALEQIYPGRPVECAVLWTKTGKLMPLSHDIVMQAIKETPYLDDSHSPT